MSMTSPAFRTACKVATTAFEELVTEAVKATWRLVEGMVGIILLSKAKGIEVAKTVTLASDVRNSSLGDGQ